jgi:hypothetical protein
MKSGRFRKAQLFLFLLRRSGSGLRSLGLGEALLEFVHATGGIHEFLCAGVKWMADIADADDDARLDGTGFDHVAARTTDFRILVLRVNISFHKRGENLAVIAVLTSANLEKAVRGFSRNFHFERAAMIRETNLDESIPARE